MKRQDIIFGIIKVLLDFIIILISFFVAKKIRLLGDFIPGLHLKIQTIDDYNLFVYSLYAGIILIFIFSIHKLYKIRIVNSKIKEFLNIILYGFYSFLFFSVVVYLGKGLIFDIEIPRLIIIYAFFIGIFSIILERILLNNLQYYLIRKKIFGKSNLVIISNKSDEKIKKIIDDIKMAGIYNIVGYSNDNENKKSLYKYLTLEKLSKEIESRKIDEIIYIDSDYSKTDLYKVWELTRIFDVRYRYLTNNFDITKTNTSLTLINEIPVLELKNTSLSGWNIVWKRIFDIFSSVFGLIIFLPVFVIISILIKIEDPLGPIIYKNKRVGKDGKHFNLYKFRYLKWKYCNKDSYSVSEKEKQNALDYEEKLIKEKSTRNGPLYKIKDDPRKTNIGSFIEKYSIDELPQFLNVLIGNMSLVGPRPHQPREVEKYLIHHKRVLTIKPGITGMAQVNGREENDFDREAGLDIYYIENWSILLDLKIILKTFVSIISRIKK